MPFFIADNVYKPLCFAFFARGQYPLYGTHSQENAIYLTSSAINGAIMCINRFALRFCSGAVPLYGTHSQENAIYLTSSAINRAIMRINRFDFLKTLTKEIILLIFSDNDSTISLSLMKEMILWLIYIRSSRLLRLTA